MARKPPPLKAPPRRSRPPDRGARAASAFGFEATDDGPLRDVPIDAISPNPRQPRRDLDTQALDQLAESIDTLGLMSPPVVREAADGYELVAGERRWRACRKLGRRSIAVLVQPAEGDAQLLAMTVAENAARQDLNAVDEAHAFAALLDEFALTQQELGRRVGKSQEDISNSIRLLGLPDSVLLLLSRRELTKAHGKILLSEPDHQRRTTLAAAAARDGWSVRELRDALGPKSPAKRRPEPSADAEVLAQRLSDALSAATGLGVKARATVRGQVTFTVHHSVAAALVAELGVEREALCERDSR